MSLNMQCSLQWRQYDLKWILLGQHAVGACTYGPSETLAVTWWLDDWIRAAELGHLRCFAGASMADEASFFFLLTYEAHFMCFSVVLANISTEYCAVSKRHDCSMYA
jgi:hypothetical protein